MKFLMVAIVATLMMFGGATAKADLLNPVGISSTYDTIHVGLSYDLASWDLGQAFKLPALKGITVNTGVVGAQTSTANWSSAMVGPQANIEWKRIAAGIYYDAQNRRSQFNVLYKFPLK